MCDRVPEPINSRRELRMRRPDDWHHHLRDGPDVLRDTVRAAARTFSRAIIMPNLVPPVTTVAAAGEYRERIEAALAGSGGAPGSFTPLMTLYLTDTTTVAAVEAAAASGFIKAFKLYPAGATTNSDSGVTDYAKIEPALRARLAEIARDHARLRLTLRSSRRARRRRPPPTLASPSQTPFRLPRLQAHPHEDYDHDLWFQAYTPAQEDGCYISSPAGVLNADGTWDEKTVCWWHMADGAVLGVQPRHAQQMS